MNRRPRTLKKPPITTLKSLCTYVSPAGVRCKHEAQEGTKLCIVHAADYQIMTVCEVTSPDGKKCKNPALKGDTVCWRHASKDKREAYIKRRGKDKNKDIIAKSTTKPLKEFIKQTKPYEGLKVIADKEEIVQIKGGDICGYYNGSFMTEQQRNIFQSAPVGTIDDDIRVIRFLVRDAFQNQMLYLEALAQGRQLPGGWVEFSKEIFTGQSKDGAPFTSNKTIKRKKDYSEEIQKLQRLLVTMETARIQILQNQTQSGKKMEPFILNVYPPSCPDKSVTPEVIQVPVEAKECLANIEIIKAAEEVGISIADPDDLSEEPWSWE